jgi:hypothetical protein
MSYRDSHLLSNVQKFLLRSFFSSKDSLFCICVMSSMRKFKRRASCLPRPTTLLSSPLRLWTRCEKGRKNDMEPFFATREVKKFGLEGGLLCLYECVFGVLQLRKIPKRASSVFPSNLSCQKLRPEGKPIDAFSVFRRSALLFFTCLQRTSLRRGERRRRRGKEKESHLSVQKDGVNGVFYCLVFLLFASGLPCLGAFRLVFFLYF